MLPGLVSGLSEGIAWLKGSRSNINASYNVTCEPVNHPLPHMHQPVVVSSSSASQHGRSGQHYPPAAGLPPPTPRSARTPAKALDGGIEPYTPKIMGAAVNGSNNHATNADNGGSNMKRFAKFTSNGGYRRWGKSRKQWSFFTKLSSSVT